MQYGVFLFFGSFVAIMTIYIAICLPETKGVMVENIMAAWATCVACHDAPACIACIHVALDVRIVMTCLRVHVTMSHKVSRQYGLFQPQQEGCLCCRVPALPWNQEVVGDLDCVPPKAGVQVA